MILTFPATIHVPVEFEDCAVLEELLSEKRGRKVEISHAAARAKKGDDRLGGIEREAQFRAAFSCR